MKITPRVVEQNKNITYKLVIKNINNIKNIESIYVFSKTNYFHNEKVEFSVFGNEIFFDYSIPYLGEFAVKVNFNYKESKIQSLFCVQEELINLKPLRGDLHMHSIYSDGKRTPFAMALASLEAGMDFISITDHDNYKGSLEAIKKVKQHDIDLIVLPGEEVSVGKGDTTLSRGNGHMLCINANKSIEDQRKDDKKYEKELEEIAKDLEQEELEEGIEPLHYARNIWALNKIHEAEGIAILCHPNWIYYDHKYHLHQPIYKQMLKNSKLDGVEVIGDIDKIEECNNLTYLTFMQNKNKFKKLAAISNSDAHDSNHDLGIRYSVLFVNENSIKGIVNSIKEARSVAVLKRSEIENQVIGEDFLCSYVHFLLKEYFPKVEKLKYRLSRLHLDALINNFDFDNKIESTKQKIKNHENSFFMGKETKSES